MNARRAKRLRRTAKALTPDQPAIAYEDTYWSWRFKGQLRLEKTCARSLYQYMKSPRYREIV